MIPILLDEIKLKIQKISMQNEHLKKFNYKMEALIVSLETFTIQEDENLDKSKDTIKTQQYCYKNEIISKPTILNHNKINKEYNFNDIPDIQKVSKLLKKEQTSRNYKPEEISSVDMSQTSLDTSLLFDLKNDVLSKALTDKNLSKVNKGHLIKVLDVLNKNKQGIMWEDLIQKSGVPRYKCIEILNCLVKSDPPLMIKKRDKGFTCFINPN